MILYVCGGGEVETDPFIFSTSRNLPRKADPFFPLVAFPLSPHTPLPKLHNQQLIDPAALSPCPERCRERPDLVRRLFGLKNILLEEYFIRRIFSLKNIWFEEYLVERIFGRKNIWKNIWQDEYLLGRIFGKKNIWKNIW